MCGDAILHEVVSTVEDETYQQRNPFKRGKIYYFFVFLNIQNIKEHFKKSALHGVLTLRHSR
jgi:hypothetical protein